ncbi:MAG: ATPase, T2SS/T4P/T4SS family [Candidatus Micrarchaeota archaeon]
MKIFDKYTVISEGVPAEVTISEKDEEYINTYDVKQTKIQKATEKVLGYLKERIIDSVNIKTSEILDPREVETVRKKFIDKAEELVTRELIGTTEDEKKILVSRLAHELIGLGEIELLLADDQLEEIVINSSREPVYIYHKKYGWLKTNILVESEEQIQNYASIIGRKVGRQITNLSPLLDAHLTSGDRVNATLFPISSKGNSITIRKFAKTPWTIVSLLDPQYKTLNFDIAALLWLCLQYEMNIIVGGGTASGKTSILNALLVFTPPNQRVVSIEDTRELYLPEYLHWTPLVTRQPNPEGKGEITMLDLMVNSLRMRPDRIVLGEVRRQREAEVLFEAMHTGHAVYATVHADDADQVKNRLTSPPINLPENMLGALHLTIVQYRQRRTGIRRTFEVAEFVSRGEMVIVNKIFKWNPRQDTLDKVGEHIRLMNDLLMFSGMTSEEMLQDLEEKKRVLNYMVAHKIYNVEDVGRVVALYYRHKDRLNQIVADNSDPREILRPGALAEPVKEQEKEEKPAPVPERRPAPAVPKAKTPKK